MTVDLPPTTPTWLRPLALRLPLLTGVTDLTPADLGSVLPRRLTPHRIVAHRLPFHLACPYPGLLRHAVLGLVRQRFVLCCCLRDIDPRPLTLGRVPCRAMPKDIEIQYRADHTN